mgnify:CR=1 FL=1
MTFLHPKPVFFAFKSPGRPAVQPRWHLDYPRFGDIHKLTKFTKRKKKVGKKERETTTILLPRIGNSNCRWREIIIDVDHGDPRRIRIRKPLRIVALL